jgi:phosphoribosylaminoimidazole carboxylase PurE protein
MSEPRVAILMGSDSDWDVMKAAATTLRELGIEHEVRVSSAHRTPAETAAYVAEAPSRGVRVFICAAGMAAHLAGAVAAHTTLPVIGVPLGGSAVNGIDALLSTVQMPKGIPVATVAIGSAGAENAALLAAQILAVADESVVSAADAPVKTSLREQLLERRKQGAAKVRAANEKLQKELSGGRS